jgi:ribosomal protein L25 (general stress protein Ctc)
MEMIVKAVTRKVQGTGASRRLRIAEKVPGILYGADKPPPTSSSNITRCITSCVRKRFMRPF